MAGTNGCAEPWVTTLVPSDETAGRLAVVRLHETKGQELPRHLHANEDEFLYVLDGVLTLRLGDEMHRLGTGACAFLPRGIEHGYALETAAARLLMLLLPAGLERFFDEVNAMPADAGLERLIIVAARYGLAMTDPEAT